MAMKVKIFSATLKVGEMEKEINDFIRGKKVSSIQFQTSMNGVAVMVVYEE
jgi:hypothetical protein